LFHFLLSCKSLVQNGPQQSRARHRRERSELLTARTVLKQSNSKEMGGRYGPCGGSNLVSAGGLILDSAEGGGVDLIYIDPPFDVGADFTMNIPVGDEKETIMKDQSALEMVAYRDMWGKGKDSFIAMIYERLMLMPIFWVD
jgi:hypothetical protein